ncbi:hypothetical protein ACHAW5_002473 [Stephanodiscus triporus]|uniref:TRAF3-interacting protein 1 n=1 Tax=Stephanodiscus triporus TaxID=2934178 RepID=A0ABD3QLA1_9STRA
MDISPFSRSPPLNATGFPNGFFTTEELDSSMFKDDKKAKMSFLNKLIHLVNVGIGSALEVSSSQIVAGLEPLNTNRLLITFGRIATDENIARHDLVQHCLNGKGIDEFHQRQNTPCSIQPENPPPKEEAIDVIDSFLERIKGCNDDVEQTRTMISKVIDKPKCTDALLGKPPFRFIHDIITEIGRTTQFDLCQIFSDDELISSNVSEKGPKLQFCEKLITFLERCLEIPINVKPAKIISGLDPERTRYLLQLFTVVATTKDLKMAASEEINDQCSLLVQEEKENASPTKDKVAHEAPLTPSLANLKVRPATARGARPSVIKEREIKSIKATDFGKPAANTIKDEVGCEFEGFPGAAMPGRETIPNRLHHSLNENSTYIDFQSLSRAINHISQLTASFDFQSLADNVEKMTNERSRWIAEQNIE